MEEIMDIKFEEFTKHTTFTIHEVELDKHLFDDYGLEKIRNLKNVDDDAKEKKKNLRNLSANYELLEKDGKSLKESSYNLYNIAHKTVAASSRDLTPIYFKDVNRDKIKGKLNLILAALKSGYVIIENDSYDEIDHLKLKFENEIAKLEEFISEFAEKSEELQSAKDSFLNAESYWKEYYGGLKGLVKFQLVGKDVNYKKYFLDLAK